MKRRFGPLLPVIIFLSFSCWIYDALFVTRTQIVLRNASAQRFDSVDMRIEWVIPLGTGRNPFDSMGTERVHHHFGSIGAGEWKGVDIDLQNSWPTLWIVYRSGERKYGYHSKEPSSPTDLPVEIDLKAEIDSALDVRAKERLL